MEGKKKGKIEGKKSLGSLPFRICVAKYRKGEKNRANYACVAPLHRLYHAGEGREKKNVTKKKRKEEGGVLAALPSYYSDQAGKGGEKKVKRKGMAPLLIAIRRSKEGKKNWGSPFVTRNDESGKKRGKVTRPILTGENIMSGVHTRSRGGKGETGKGPPMHKEEKGKRKKAGGRLLSSLFLSLPR